MQPFVQILHIPDHWVCVSNILSSETHEIWLFDSMHPTRVSSALTVQLTSLLRLVENPDKLSAHIRNCPRQPFGTLTCGFYAIAAATALCKRQDPTTMSFSPCEMVTSVFAGLETGELNITCVVDPNIKSLDLKTYFKQAALCLSQAMQR
jgi:hypothetical protein